eukprot:TRINITY_DN10406_c0_g1_i1.p1 TRINITY_DN10406_c0_g1~~TRINITY_DN10406_c0_g1_i1.p1  ORF type:complete len:349 (+),score=54.56 TRINITY_DN10406_c0_g1_i1:141-1187(+)
MSPSDSTETEEEVPRDPAEPPLRAGRVMTSSAEWSASGRSSQGRGRGVLGGYRQSGGLSHGGRQEFDQLKDFSVQEVAVDAQSHKNQFLWQRSSPSPANSRSIQTEGAESHGCRRRRNGKERLETSLCNMAGGHQAVQMLPQRLPHRPQKQEPSAAMVGPVVEVVPCLASDATIQLVAGFLRLCVDAGHRKQRPTCFHCVKPPSVDLHEYLVRLVRYFPLSEECLLCALVYIDRLCKRFPALVISSLSIHRLLATSLTLTVKFLHDHYFPNHHYAKVAGFKPQELFVMEGEFLRLMDWRLHLKSEELLDILLLMRRCCSHKAEHDVKGSTFASYAHQCEPHTSPACAT